MKSPESDGSKHKPECEEISLDEDTYRMACQGALKAGYGENVQSYLEDLFAKAEAEGKFKIPANLENRQEAEDSLSAVFRKENLGGIDADEGLKFAAKLIKVGVASIILQIGVTFVLWFVAFLGLAVATGGNVHSLFAYHNRNLALVMLDIAVKLLGFAGIFSFVTRVFDNISFFFRGVALFWTKTGLVRSIRLAKRNYYQLEILVAIYYHKMGLQEPEL